MSNMSYCRFQNTLRDLQDCQEALEELFQEGKGLSDEERWAAKRLISTCNDIVELVTEDYDIERDDPNFDSKIEKVLEQAAAA